MKDECNWKFPTVPTTGAETSRLTETKNEDVRLHGPQNSESWDILKLLSREVKVMADEERSLGRSLDPGWVGMNQDG